MHRIHIAVHGSYQTKNRLPTATVLTPKPLHTNMAKKHAPTHATKSLLPAHCQLRSKARTQTATTGLKRHARKMHITFGIHQSMPATWHTILPSIKTYACGKGKADLLPLSPKDYTT